MFGINLLWKKRKKHFNMSVSTNGQICYGVVFPDGYEFPWGESNIDDWWLEECGYKPSINIYADTETGYVDNKKPDQKIIDQYYDEKVNFLKDHLIPVAVVNYCSGDYPMYLLAIPRTFKQNFRGEAAKIDPKE